MATLQMLEKRQQLGWNMGWVTGMAQSTDLSGEHSGQLGLAIEWKAIKNSPKEDGRDL